MKLAEATLGASRSSQPLGNSTISAALGLGGSGAQATNEGKDVSPRRLCHHLRPEHGAFRVPPHLCNPFCIEVSDGGGGRGPESLVRTNEKHRKSKLEF